MTAQLTASEAIALPVFAAGETPAEQIRVEVKHCVPESLAAEVSRTARLFLQPERFGERREPQEIRSLYLDTPTLTFFRWHVGQALDRFKLRVRAYGSLQPEYVYAEIKRKTRSVSHKRRAEVPFAVLSSGLDSVDLLQLELATRSATNNLRQFIRYRITYGAVPQLVTRSLRESLRGAANDPTAVTVDRSVSYQPAREFDFAPDPKRWRTIALPHKGEPATAIVEVKHGHSPPAWLVSILQRLNPWRTSFSKYIAAIKDLEPWHQ